MYKINKRIAVVFFILGILLLLATPYASPGFSSDVNTLKPDFFPKFVGWFTIVCSIGLFIQNWLDKRNGKEPEEFEERDKKREGKVLLIFVMLVVYATLCTVIGFLLASILFVCAFMAVLDVKTWWYYAVSVTCVFIIFFCFRYLLYVHLPVLGVWIF